MISLFHEHCGDDWCQRHRVLAGYPSSIWIKVALSMALTFGATGSLDDWFRVKADEVVESREPKTLDFMPVVFADRAAGSAEADLAVMQWPRSVYGHEEPDSRWAIVVHASGSVDVLGDRNVAIREWFDPVFDQMCRSRDGRRLLAVNRTRFNDPQLEVSAWIHFPPFNLWGCTTVSGAAGHIITKDCREPWYAHTSWPAWSVAWAGDLQVHVKGQIPASALQFWHDVASHTPTCEDR